MRRTPSLPVMRLCWASSWRKRWKWGSAPAISRRLSSRLSLLVDNFEIEQNGLGFNNLIFMAVVLSELVKKNAEASYRGLVIESLKPIYILNSNPSCCAIWKESTRTREKSRSSFSSPAIPRTSPASRTWIA